MRNKNLRNKNSGLGIRKCKRQKMSHRTLDPYFFADRCRLIAIYYYKYNMLSFFVDCF